MITWIQIRIQKHLRLLFLALLIVMVVTFVLTIGNQSFFGSKDDGHFKTKDFYGYNLASDNTTAYLEHAAQLSAMLSQEMMMEPNNHLRDTDKYSKERAVALSLANQLGITEPTEEQLRAYIRTKPLFQDENGQFSAKNYKSIMEMLSSRQQVSEASILSIFSDDYRISKVRKLLGGAGFVNPDLIALQRQSMDTEWTIDVANVSLDDFKPAINPSRADLEKFYNDNTSRFQIAERIKLLQVQFPAEAYMASIASPADDMVNAIFERNKAYYSNGAKDAEGKPVEPVLDEAMRARVVRDIVLSQAVQAASQKADEYTVALWRDGNSMFDQTRVFELAKTMGAQTTPVEPYAKGNPPRSQDADAEQFDNLWSLATSERYFSDVIPGMNGASVYIFLGTVPSRMPAFDEVQDKVLQTYVADKRNALFVGHGSEMSKQLQSSVAKGEDFTAAAKAFGLTVVEHSKIKLNDAAQELLRNGGPLDVANRMKVGTVSAMQITPAGGFIVFLKDKHMPPIDAVRGKPEEIAQIRTSFATVDGWEVLSSLSDKRIAELEAELESRKSK